MTREDYPCRQGPDPSPRRTREGANWWGRMMYERDMAWQVYAALRDGVNPWRNMPIPTVEALAGFYGRDYADE